MFGPRVLGEAGAAAEQLKINNGIGGGSIQFGPRVLNGALPVFENEKPEPKTAVKAAPKPATASRNRVAPAKRATSGKKGAPVQEAYSEAEVETLLGEDPNAWPRVITAESKRPFIRFAIARMVLEVRSTATDPALTPKVITQLEAVLAPRVAEPRVPKGLPKARAMPPAVAEALAGAGAG